MLSTSVSAQEDGDKADPAAGESDTEVEIEVLTPERLSAYEEDLKKLKERIAQSKARLSQLYEQLKLGSVSIVGINILHTQEVGKTFYLESITYHLDNFEIYSAVNTEDSKLTDFKEMPIYRGSLLPGEHILVVDQVYRGSGYGVFSYLNQYLFKVKSRYMLTVEEGDVVTVKVISYDEGSFLTRLKDRLKVKFIREQ